MTAEGLRRLQHTLLATRKQWLYGGEDEHDLVKEVVAWGSSHPASTNFSN